MVAGIDLGDEDVQIALFVVVALVIAIPIFLYQVVGPSAVEVFSVIVTSLLTLGLIVLYFQQSAILDRQTKLKSREFQSALTKQGWAVAEGDEIHVRLRNSGRGRVHRIFLKSEIVSDTAGLELDHGRVVMSDIDDGSIEIPPESGPHEFAGEVRFRILNYEGYDPDRGHPFRLVSRLLCGNGIDTVRLRLTLEVVDEGIVDDQFSYTFEIADQTLTLEPPETRSVEGEDQPFAQSTSVEEGIEHIFSSTQDINKERWDQIADGQSSGGG